MRINNVKPSKHRAASNKNEAPKGEQILPEDTPQALKFLIMVSEKMIAISEREMQILLQGDLASFSILQNEKESVSTRYAKASNEFRARLSEFRSADKTMLNKLENLQRRLGEITHSNRDMVSRMFKNSSKKTHESLITVQELAQKHVVNEAKTEHKNP